VLRTGYEPPSAAADTYDLLLGIMLAHPADSVPRVLLEYFDIPPGSVLAAHYPRPLGADELARERRRLPGDEQPPLEGDAMRVVMSARGSGPDDLVELRGLAVALLGEPDAGGAAQAVADAVAERGADRFAVLDTLRRSLDAPEPAELAQLLREAHPWSPPRVQVPPYGADEPGARRPPRGAGAPPDLVGIRAEVDAFAYLLASTSLAPPLAVGLFGDWGSGKSFFMRALQRRIDAITSSPEVRGRPQSELPFFRDVAQIEFNAWHYVEGNLWASLVEHVFQNLRTSADEGRTEVERRKDRVLERMRAIATERERASGRLAGAQAEVRRRRAQLRLREGERAQRLRQLERKRASEAVLARHAAGAVREAAHEAAERVGVERLGDSYAALSAELAAARAVVARGGPVLAGLRAGGWRAVAVVVLVLALTPVVAAVLSALDLSAVTSGVGALAWVLGWLATLLKAGTSVVEGAIRRIERAQAALDADIERTRRELDAEVAHAQEALRSSEAGVAQAREELAEADRALAERRRELEGITPASVLVEFLQERVGSDDYRRHLGVPALIRRDFEHLSELIEERNADLLAGGDRAAAAERDGLISRIVLYIDDLDRCPPARVVEVLQAVHLLLAFPLFAVVVAVDRRWLAGSLRRHYGELIGAAMPERPGEQVGPEAYLEKIFQVPFQVEALDDRARARMLRGLLLPRLEAVAAGGDGAAAARPEPPEEDVAELVPLLFAEDRRDPQWLEAADLGVTMEELAAMESVRDLIGETPRSVKRFVNLFLLAKAVAASSGRPFDPASPEPRDHERAILLLALVAGHPDEAERLIAEILRRPPGDTLGTSPVAAGCPSLAGWLDGRPDHWRTVALESLEPVASIAGRFSFGASPSAAAAAPTTDPA
jgi:hypothetical protein